MSGAVIGSVEVRDDVFGAPMNEALVHQVMVGQLANRRQGTAKVKTRAEVSGGGAKPRPQKGTGQARQGSIRSPQWKGGGIVFGPTPRSYRQRTPKRMKRESLRIMLSDKVRAGQLLVVEKLELEEARTREMAKLLAAFKVESSVLLVCDGAEPDVIRAAHNIPRVKTIPANLLNTVDLIHARKVIMTLEAVYKAEQIWGGDFVRRKVAAGDVGPDPDSDDSDSGDSESGDN